jgi:glycosyltransferase involved in cell wall biosynthesis
MKVALISFDFGEYCIRLASALARETEVLLMLPHQRAAPHVSKLDQAVRFQPFSHPRLRQPLQQMRMIYTILRHINRYNPDVIHFQGCHLWFTFALPLLRCYPLVITIHDPRYHVGDRESQKTPQMIMHSGYHRADQVIVHSKQLKQVVVEELGFASQIVHVVPMIALGDDLAYSQVQEDNHQILFFGRIWEYKGLEYLIRAEPLITAQVPEAMIVIAGRGEDFTRYQRLMVHPEHFTVYNEYVSDAKCTELFQRASVVALPYIDASQSAVIPVAYTFGKPVVATTVGGLPELVEHGQTGYLVPPRDEQALADALVCLLRDKELRQRLGSNGKRKVETDLSPDAVARQTLAVYRQAIGDRIASVKSR